MKQVLTFLALAASLSAAPQIAAAQSDAGTGDKHHAKHMPIAGKQRDCPSCMADFVSESLGR